ncbi:hypothetical protein RB599_010286 [Gaeumannomyces hyphopodioides]
MSTDKITFLTNWHATPYHAPVYLAQAKGYFKDEGIKVALLEPNDPSDVTEIIGSGKADLGFKAMIHTLAAKARGFPVVSVGTLLDEPFTGVIYLKGDSGITPDFRSLRGKRIGYVGEFGKVQIDELTGHYGMATGDYTAVRCGMNVSKAIIEGTIDAGVGLENVQMVELEECVGYKEWKEKGGEGQRLPIKTREDAAKWEKFIDVARDGSKVKSRCIGPLKTVGRYWGAGFVQHYQLASKGERYCEVIGAAAREVRGINEVVTKLNRLMLRRHLATGRGRRRLREVVNPIDQADLVDLKAWSHRDSFDKDKDSLPYRKLAAADLPPGFGFDKFGLIVREKFAVSLPADTVEAAARFGVDITGRSGPNDACSVGMPGLVPPDGANPGDPNFNRFVEQVLDSVLADEEPKGLSAASENEDTSSTKRHANAAHSSSPGRSQSTTPLSSPPKSPLATLSAAGVPFGNAARGLADTSPPADDDADDCRLPEDQSFRQLLRSRVTNSDKSGGGTAESARNADCQHATNAPVARLRGRSGKPGYYEAPPRRSKPLRQPELLSTARLQERCCPPKISSMLLAFLDKMDGIAIGQMPAFILVGVPFQDMCYTHLKKYTEAVTSTESFGSSPKAEKELQTAGLNTSDTPRRRRASLSELIDTTPLKRLRSDNQDASGHGHLPATSSLDGWPRHDSIRDEAYRRRVLRDIESTEHEPNSWGSQTDALVSQILFKSRPPTDEEAYFLSGEEASQRAELGSVDVPIFTQGQQRFQWKGKDRPILQLFHHMEDLGLDRTVSVQVPSRSSLKESSERKTLFQVRNRFLGQGLTSDPWNLLDLQGSLPSTLPFFLEGDNCQLLLRVRDAILMGNDAQRIAASGEDWNTWRNVVEWALLSEGHNTAPHMDSHGYSTWITVQEGSVGFGWMSRPSQQEKDEWIANPHGYAGGKWKYVILSPGHTVFFPSGTIHFVFRAQGVQTFALGGHVLQWSGIEQWLEVVVAQLKTPEITNEDMASSAPKYVQVVKRLVANRMKAGRVEEMGGRDAVARLSALLKDFDSVAGGSSIKMSKPRTPLRQQEGLGHSIPCQPPRRLLPTCAPKRSA